MKKKIVIKISSNLLNLNNKIDIVERLSEEIAPLTKKGYQFIIVTSGAVMHGLLKLQIDKRPRALPILQCAASVGQIDLMKRYEKAFLKYNLTPAQILIDKDDFKLRTRYLNLRNMLEEILRNKNVIPIVNENDSINTEELKFGDNDHISALITLSANFDRLIILTDVDGLFDKDPKTHKDANLLTNIDILDESYLTFTSSKISAYSSGGMKSKIEASIKATRGGVEVFIGNGFIVSINKIIDRKEKGTYIKPNNQKTNAKKKWLGFTPGSDGIIKIDEGAYKALKEKKSSLLSLGVVAVKGDFNRGDIVNVLYNNKKIAQGITNYNSEEINQIIYFNKIKKKGQDFYSENYYRDFSVKDSNNKVDYTNLNQNNEICMMPFDYLSNPKFNIIIHKDNLFILA